MENITPVKWICVYMEAGKRQIKKKKRKRLCPSLSNLSTCKVTEPD